MFGCYPRQRARCAAFTLIECLCAIAVLAFVVAAVCTAVVSGQQNTASALKDMRGLSLAEAMMEEVLATPYKDPTSGLSTASSNAGNANRTLYTRIADFNGSTENAGSVVDASRTAYASQYQRFKRTVTVTPGTVTVTGLGGAITGMTVVVTLQDTQGSGTWTLTRFVAEPP